MALSILRQVERGQKSSAALNSAFGKNLDLSQIDRALTTELVYGVLRWRSQVDRVIQQFSDKPLSKLTPLVLDGLRLGVYQLIFLEKMVPYAAIYETVELIKKTPEQKAAPFMNAVLREVDRKRSEIQKFFTKKSEKIEDLAVQYAHPEWLIKRWILEYGMKEALNICQTNNSIAPLCIRINKLKGSRKEWLDLVEIQRSDLEWKLANSSPQGVYIFKGGSVENLPGQDDGWFQVQDEASQLVALAMDPKPGERILDCCAAPGGKATHMAELMQDEGQIIAMDRDAERLNLVNKNCERLKLKSIKLKNADLLKEKNLGLFDRILVDAPCSAFGTFRRRPEAKWNRSIIQMKELEKMQRQLLDKAAHFLKPEGVLVYSVCTFSKEETTAVVSSFIQNHPEFVVESLKSIFPEACKDLVSKEGWIKVFPQSQGMDGYFMVRFKKK